MWLAAEAAAVEPSSWLTAIGIGNLSAGALVAVLVLMLFTGRLVTRREHEGRIADKEKQLAAREREAEQWRSAHATSEAARQVVAASTSELAEQGRLNVELLRSVARHADDPHRGNPGART